MQATRHLIRVQPNPEPINTRPYRFPDTQKVEVEKQVEKLLKEGVIQQSNSPWNSPILVGAKMANANGQSSWLQIQRSRVRLPALPDFLRSSGSGTGSTPPRYYNLRSYLNRKVAVPGVENKD
jgi:hypothetical protein